MAELIITVLLAAGISGLCSMAEAMLYSIPWTHIEKLKSEGSKAGELLYNLRVNVDAPIAAILTLNTLANTAGASLAGALAAEALGAGNTLYFAIAFTLLILIVGEIIPKTLGVAYAAPLSILMAYPIKLLVIFFTPFIFFAKFLTRLITPKDREPSATEDDIRVMASLSRKSGKIQPYEETAIDNILALDKKRVEDVMTPRTIVYSLPAETTLQQAVDDHTFWHFSRIPVYDEDNEDIVGLAMRREVSIAVQDGKGDLPLSSIMHPVHFTLESTTLDVVLHEFLDSHQHLFVVLDEYGGLAGVISLEDVLEEFLGREIVDESDVATDLRAVAKVRRAATIAQAAASGE